MNCKKCNKGHDGSFGSGMFCSRTCANSRTWADTDKTKKSIAAKKSSLVLFANREKAIGKSLKKECPICFSNFKVPISESHRIFCSRDCYSKDVNFNFKKKNSGGYRPGSGIGKSGWYKGYWCDSSWELAWVIYNLDHKINFSRNKEGFEYVFKGSKHKYFPDFKQDDFYIEIKGRLLENDKCKIEQFPLKLKVLFKKDITFLLDYVSDKYGHDFVKLYENNPHKVRSNKCIICGEPAKNKFCSRKCSGISISKNH